MYDYPAAWLRGQLLNLRRFTDGHFTATLLGDEAKNPDVVVFPSGWEAQQFIAWWYAPTSVRETERESCLPPAAASTATELSSSKPSRPTLRLPKSRSSRSSPTRTASA